MTKVPDILYVDDEPEDLLGNVQDKATYDRFETWVPDQGASFPLTAATSNLWVFDFYNDPGQKEKPDLAGVTTNGLSLFHQFRLLTEDERPPAVLASSDLEAALGCVVLGERRHALAEQVGVEWVVEKSEDPLNEILSLANSTGRVHAQRVLLQRANPANYAAEFAKVILGLPAKRAWTAGAVQEVDDWRPPVWLAPHDESRSNRSKSGFPLRPGIRSARDVIAWMLRRVLAYPSFLLRDRHVAVRLGVTIPCLRQALGGQTGIAKKLQAVRYRGILSDFSGPRWWTAGIDAFVWDLPRQEELRISELRKLFAPVAVRQLSIAEPVCVSDADLIETDEILPASKCVRASDEHFPPQSAYAWVKTEDARANRALARRVRQDDQAEVAG